MFGVIMFDNYDNVIYKRNISTLQENEVGKNEQKRVNRTETRNGHRTS